MLPLRATTGNPNSSWGTGLPSASRVDMSYLLAPGGTLATGGFAVVSASVVVTPGINLGPYANSALAQAVSPGGANLSDLSAAGSVPDANGNGNPGDDSGTTTVTFTGSPELGVALRVFSGPVSNGDGSFSLTYRLLAENSGDVLIAESPALRPPGLRLRRRYLLYRGRRPGGGRRTDPESELHRGRSRHPASDRGR